MTEHPSIHAMWQSFVKENPAYTDRPYQAWAFGDGTKKMADDLCDLVVKGIKRGTSSYFLEYEKDGSPLPTEGQMNLILDGDGVAQAIMVTTKIDLLPYNEVTEEHAFAEGEGDQTLAYWKSVHQPFFSQLSTTLDSPFNETDLVVYEWLKLVHK
ncbi:ASCH domain-containing protein [Shouchella sp. JSM 1781072]|uniref:ASCH domain-containing protein n=1 Tax=Bacillaceae TaxID=186817 RepID=UPI000C069C3D|nr:MULTISPECIES: ASCH domain-containing protein [Bacillaceae]UTR06203.1 ASCH domain-containing protein [Alkalihalobacillus sp. LMS6]